MTSVCLVLQDILDWPALVQPLLDEELLDPVSWAWGEVALTLVRAMVAKEAVAANPALKVMSILKVMKECHTS